MTEKRFQWVFIKDNELELRDNGIVKRFNNERLEELLNELHEELQKCKQYNTILYQNSTRNNREYLKQVTELEKENEHIKETIIMMLENERTELGQSVLKQLQARIQE